MKHKQTASTEINSSAAMSTHSSSSSTLSVSAPNTSNTSNSSIIPCVREVFGCKNKVNEYNDKECAICPDCRSKLEIMFNSSPFSPTLCPCCHDPSFGPPYAFCLPRVFGLPRSRWLHGLTLWILESGQHYRGYNLYQSRLWIIVKYCKMFSSENDESLLENK